MINSNSIDNLSSNDENEAESTLLSENNLDKKQKQQPGDENQNESFNVELKNILESFESYINDLIDVILSETKSVFESAIYSSNYSSSLSLEKNNHNELRRKVKNPHRLNFMISKIIKMHKIKLNKNLQSRIENIKNLVKSNKNELGLDVEMIMSRLNSILEKFELFVKSLIDKLNEINTNNNDDSENESNHTRYTDFLSDTEFFYASKHISKKKLKNIFQSFNKDGKLINFEPKLTNVNYVEHTASDNETDNLNISNGSPLQKKPFNMFSQINEYDLEESASVISFDVSNENYNADEEEEEDENDSSTLNDTVSEKISEKSFILIDDENEYVNQPIREQQSESNHKKIKNIIHKNKLINESYTGLDHVYAGMKVLALKNKKRHIWKMATILNVENPVKDEKLKDYDVICNCTYKIRFEPDFDEEDCGGYKYSDDLVKYAISDSDEDEIESIPDSVNQDSSENNDDEDVLCLDDDYVAKNDDCLKRKLNSENSKFVKKKSNCNTISILDAKCLAYINNFEKFLPNNFDANIGSNKTSYKSNEQEFILQTKSRVVSYYQLLIKDKNKIIINNEYLTSGTIVELPSLHNLNRYLIFFDNGLCSYVKPTLVYPIFDLFAMPVDRLHMDHAQFMKNYFDKHPERTMVKFSKSNKVNVYLANKWYLCTVLDTDLSLVKLEFKNVILNKENNKKSTFSMWMYRGSFRLQPLFNNFIDEFKKLNKDASKMSLLSSYHLYVKDKYTSYIGQYDKNNHYLSVFASSLFPDVDPKIFTSKRVALKNTGSRASSSNSNEQELAEQSKTMHINQGNVKHLDLQSLIRDEVIVYNPHACTISCVNRYEENLYFIKHVNPLLIPMMHGWQRQIHHQSRAATNNVRKRVNYVAPCGRTLRTITEVDKYLAMTDSKITLDKFSFDIYIHTDREFEGRTKSLKIEDITNGQEPMPISCVNSVDDTEPEKFAYSSSRKPLDGVPLVTDESKMEGCDCVDGCRDRMRCSCWKKTFSATQFLNGDQINYNVGYRGRRLNDMVKTGIFECNSNCKCDHRCGNRVVQNGLSVRLQLFKTVGKGWGLRCLDDIAKGTFICTYAGDIITEGIFIFNTFSCFGLRLRFILFKIRHFIYVNI